MKDVAQAKVDLYVVLLYKSTLTKTESKLLCLIKNEPEVIERIKQAQEIVKVLREG